MSTLLDIVTKLQDTEVEIRRLERHLAEGPTTSVSMALRSVYKRKERLEEAFSALAEADFQDVCDYRLIPEGNEPCPISALADALKDFQTLVTTVFDAVKTKPKRIARLSAEVVQQSQLCFAYTYPGSLGVKLTIQNERMVAYETELDRSFDLMFQLAKAQSSSDIAALAHDVGIASVRKLYTWSDHHQKYGMSANIKWMRGDEIKNEILVQPPELASLCRIIEETSDEEEEPISVTGKLVGLDSDKRTFHMQFPEGEDIQGVWGGDFRNDPHTEIDETYTAELIKSTVTHYSTEQEDETHYLIGLTKRK